MVESRSCVQREGVYRWFSSLTSAQRAEFLCGLLDLCVPIELRFLGSCLEDLARKDYHSLRDAEIRANNPADLSGLTNITDEVVRSKLLVSLALLGSDNREAAWVLYRTLTHTDTVINNYGLALNDGRTEEQFLLLFTMASNHPAFSFHQKQVLRQQLSQIQDILQVSSGGSAEAPAVVPVGERAATGHHHQPLHHYPPPSTSLPLASLAPAARSLPDASAPYLPPPACRPGLMHCTCGNRSQSREAGTASGSGGTASGSGGTVGRGDQAVDLSPPVPRPPPLLLLLHHHLLHLHLLLLLLLLISPLSLPAGQGLDAAATKTHQGKPGKVVIERLALRGVTHTTEDTREYVFEVSWSDGFVLSVVRTHQELTELLSQLSQVFPDDGVEKLLLQSTEPDPRCLTALPGHVLQHHSVQLFFTSTRPLSPKCPSSLSSSSPPSPSSPPTAPVAPTCPFTSSSNLGCALQYRGAQQGGVPSGQRPARGQQPQLRPDPLRPPPLLPATSSPSLPSSSPAVLPLSRSAAAALPALHGPQSLHQPASLSHSLSLPYSPSRSLSHAQPPPPPPPPPGTAEQNGILDWLRKLRLHKYYPVFKQLTMEEFLALTEEDLNKVRLDPGSEEETQDAAGASKQGNENGEAFLQGELRVEVEAASHHHPVSTDSSSSSGYSSSSCSPRTPHCCDSSFDRSRDIHRRVSGPDGGGGAPEKDRSCLFLLSSSCPSGSSRPTAQVLPVQTDPAPPHPPSCSPHLPFGLPQSPYHPQASYPQTLLCPVSNTARILTSPRKPRPPPLCTEDRMKPLGSGLPAAAGGFSPGLGGGVRLENLFPGLNVDGSSSLQDAAVCRSLGGGAVGLMVETSSALTSTSNSLHHVSHPPLHFHLSSSSSPSPSGYYSYPPSSSSSSFSSYSTSSCPSTKTGSLSGSLGGGFASMASSSGPVAAVPGHTYYPAPPTSSPSPSPSSASSLDQNSGHTPSVCVCSSCGCRGNCGAYGAVPGYHAAGYLQPFSAGPSLFTLGPLLHLSPLLASPGASGSTPFSYPMMMPPPLYRHSPVSHDQQQGFGFYQPHGIMGNGGQKRAGGSLSCYNCGANGHRAEDCKQPPMDSVQQGTFRLKYTPRSDSKDSGD
ncbi:unnamed protein product [Pleuronectes platessa]|uniref:CCHC-type domain-containing protein n=1 Tax=Pleuronectes platessa TaxID=8262 RepID=A0A9N7YET5_PLEPL|nr:unnamed protein product [Pleuronectes platessa]